MIAKSHSRKTPKCLPTTEYIIGEKRRKTAFIIRHNMRGRSDSAEALAREIEENARYARHRKGEIYFYHEMLSFSPKDRPVITPQMAEWVARYYLEERLGDCGLGFAGAHWEKENIHIHVMFSAFQIKSARKLRLSKSEFDRLKVKVSGAVKDKYPELVHTYDQRKRTKGKPKERQRENRRNYRLKQEGRKAPTKKELARSAVVGAANAAKSAADFLSLLKNEGYAFYQRGRSFGVINADGLRFRLSTLGALEMAKRFIEQLKREQENLRELERIQEEKQKAKELEKGPERGREIDR